MVWWTENALLKRQLKELQNELEKEQGKASRLAGYFAHLQAFGVSPIGDVPRRPFAEALMDALYVLLKIEQAALLETDDLTLDLFCRFFSCGDKEPATGRRWQIFSLTSSSSALNWRKR